MMGEPGGMLLSVSRSRLVWIASVKLPNPSTPTLPVLYLPPVLYTPPVLYPWLAGVRLGCAPRGLSGAASLGRLFLWRSRYPP
jgi:hypothetical protein